MSKSIIFSTLCIGIKAVVASVKGHRIANFTCIDARKLRAPLRCWQDTSTPPSIIGRNVSKAAFR